jgi:hypothetical protein
MKKAFYLRVSVAAARRAPTCFERHRRDLGAGLSEEGASQKPFDGNPYTLLATAESAGVYMEHGCVCFKARMTSRFPL